MGAAELGSWRFRAPQSSEDLLSVDAASEEGGLRLAFRGELDPMTATMAEAALEEIRPFGSQTVRIDLRELTFCDSSGLVFLLRLADQAGIEGWRMVVIPGEVVRRLIDLTETSERFDLELE